MEKENIKASTTMEEALGKLDHEGFVQLMTQRKSAPALANLKEFFKKCEAQVASLVVEEAKAQATQSSNTSGEIFYKFEQTQLLEPRGRFDVTVGAGGMFLEGKAGNCFFPWKAVSHVCVVPVSASAKKEGEDVMAIQAKEPLKYNGNCLFYVLCLSFSPSIPSNYSSFFMQIFTNEYRQRYQESTVVSRQGHEEDTHCLRGQHEYHRD